MLAASLVAIAVALGTNMVGMKIGKWTENIGGVSAWMVTLLFVVLATLVWMKRGSATHLTIVPKWDWNTVNLWATIAYGMSGLELAGMMVAEVRDPRAHHPTRRLAGFGLRYALLFSRDDRARGPPATGAD